MKILTCTTTDSGYTATAAAKDDPKTIVPRPPSRRDEGLMRGDMYRRRMFTGI